MTSIISDLQTITDSMIELTILANDLALNTHMLSQEDWVDCFVKIQNIQHTLKTCKERVDTIAQMAKCSTCLDDLYLSTTFREDLQQFEHVLHGNTKGREQQIQDWGFCWDEKTGCWMQRNVLSMHSMGRACRLDHPRRCSLVRTSNRFQQFLDADGFLNWIDTTTGQPVDFDSLLMTPKNPEQSETQPVESPAQKTQSIKNTNHQFIKNTKENGIMNKDHIEMLYKTMENLNTLAKSVNSGTLMLSPKEYEDHLTSAAQSLQELEHWKRELNQSLQNIRSSLYEGDLYFTSAYEEETNTFRHQIHGQTQTHAQQLLDWGFKQEDNPNGWSLTNSLSMNKMAKELHLDHPHSCTIHPCTDRYNQQTDADGFVIWIDTTTGEPVDFDSIVEQNRDVHTKEQKQKKPGRMDIPCTRRKIQTPRGCFVLTKLSEQQAHDIGYGLSHASRDERFLIMCNGCRAFAIVNRTKIREDILEQLISRDCFQFNANPHSPILWMLHVTPDGTLQTNEWKQDDGVLMERQHKPANFDPFNPRSFRSPTLPEFWNMLDALTDQYIQKCIFNE